VFHANFQDPLFLQSSAVREGKLGPCPLARVADFVGYDEDVRPGPGARVEQFFGCTYGANRFVIC